MAFENTITIDTLHHAVTAATDSAKHIVEYTVPAHGQKFDFMHLLDHIKDSRSVELPFIHLELPQLPPVQIGGIMLDFSPTRHVFFSCFVQYFYFLGLSMQLGYTGKLLCRMDL